MQHSFCLSDLVGFLLLYNSLFLSLSLSPHLLSISLTHIYKHVLPKPSLCSQMSWETEANMPFHLKRHTHTVSVGRGVSLCRNAGMIGCRGVRGETHAVTARHPKNTPPKASNYPDSLFFSFFILLPCLFFPFFKLDTPWVTLLEPFASPFSLITLYLFFFLHYTNSLAQCWITVLPDVSDISGQDWVDIQLRVDWCYLKE